MQALLGILALYWIVAINHVDIAQIVRHFRTIDWGVLALGVGCFVVVMTLTTWRYYIFMPGRMSFRYLLGVTFLQNALLTFVPWRIGEVSYPWLLRRDYGIPLATSVVVIVSVRLVDLLVVVVVALAGSSLLQLDAGWLAAGLGAAAMLGLIIILVWQHGRRRFASVSKPWLEALGSLRKPQRLIGFLASSIAVFLVATFQSKLLLQAFALELSVANVAVLNALTLLIAVLPVHPPGGWGTIDSMQVLVLSRFGYDPALALPMILAAHSIYALVIFGGGVGGWLLRKKHHIAPATGTSE